MPKAPNPLTRRKSSASPFSSLPRKKPGSISKSAKETAVERLEDTGLTPSLVPPGLRQDVISIIRYIQEHAWEDVPDRAAGMGSERISEVLRFRRTLPPMVSIAQVHALSTSNTNADRELARLAAQGTVRKLSIPGRGKGGGAVGDGVVIVEDWKQRVSEHDGLEQELKEKYLALMSLSPAIPTTSTSALSTSEIRLLVSTGFLTTPAALSSTSSDLFSAPGASSLLNISSAGSTAATGTHAAVGGYGAIHESGGSGSMLATRDTRPPHNSLTQTMTFALPGTGAYLKLLTEARLHLLFLLKQLSPRYKEATREMLREKWEGNTLNDATSRAKRARGEWSGVLPGKTKKWREFFGMEFEWILADCVGSGVVELFDTGSVGVGVRAR